MGQVKPRMDHSERAARDILNRKVREGVIDRRNANEVLRTGLPFVRMMIAKWRREGTDPQWLTSKFQNKLVEARQQLNAAADPIAERRAKLSIVSTEMYLAVWAGMQADLGQFTADRKADATSQIEA